MNTECSTQKCFSQLPWSTHKYLCLVDSLALQLYGNQIEIEEFDVISTIDEMTLKSDTGFDGLPEIL